MHSGPWSAIYGPSWGFARYSSSRSRIARSIASSSLVAAIERWIRPKVIPGGSDAWMISRKSTERLTSVVCF
jgi:hypothetical protein